jgi:hypothetical protein
MLARKKSSRFVNNKFTLNWKIFALLLRMRKITLVVKTKSMYILPYFGFLCKCKCGALVEYQVGDPEAPGSTPACVGYFLQAWRVKRKITLVPFFREALRHICVTAGA